MHRLDEKLRRIRDGRYQKSDFVLADAKDADMGSGVSAAGIERGGPGAAPRYRTREQLLDSIAAIVAQDVIDIMLVSASNLELLQERGVFAGSSVKPAVRANDATDAWGGVRHGAYAAQPSRPFRSANLARTMYGAPAPEPGAPLIGTDLGLYSVTFANDAEADAAALEAFARFRDDAARHDFKYFLEVFNPLVPVGSSPEAIGEFVNDSILRCLAGVTRADRPQFLKIAYNGPKALEELASYDPQLVVGILGGGAGTTRDTFELLYQAERYGGRIALFGRKINLAEAPLALIALMRQVVDGALAPEEAVRVYHGELQTLGIRPLRELEDDRAITEPVLKSAASLKVA